MTRVSREASGGPQHSWECLCAGEHPCGAQWWAGSRGISSCWGCSHPGGPPKHGLGGLQCPAGTQHPPSSCHYSPVRQLIKSQRVQNKLGIVFEKEKDKTQRKDFVFVSARVGNTQLGAAGDKGSLVGMGWGRI